LFGSSFFLSFLELVLDFFAKGESHGGSWDEGKKSSVGETQGRQRKKECFLAKRYSVAPDFSLLFFFSGLGVGFVCQMSCGLSALIGLGEFDLMVTRGAVV
jgi:hypothetical protein